VSPSFHLDHDPSDKDLSGIIPDDIVESHSAYLDKKLSS